jgi:hypothetical protein
MLPSFSRGVRLALVLALSAGYVAWQGYSHPAYAKGGEDDDEEGGGDDDDDGKGKSEDDDAVEDDKDQPPVTAGGLFTMNTYPVNELLRPLTITQNLTQLRLGVGTDLSANNAFESFGVSLEAVHGIADNFMVIGGLTSAYNFKQFGFYGGFEGSLAYDLLDIRLAANLHRFAVPGTDAAGMPTGEITGGDIKFSVDLGFPFRYSVKPEIAIIALQTLMSIDFNSVAGNGAKPDLNPSLGLATNPIPQLSLVAFAQLQIPDFNTDANSLKVPVTGRVEFSPSQKFDIGLEFVLLNVKPPSGSPIDNRFLNLFIQARFGK